MRWARAATEYTQRTGQSGVDLSPHQLAFAQKMLEARDREKRREQAAIMSAAVAQGNGAKVDWDKLL